MACWARTRGTGSLGAEIDRRLVAAFERLALGRPELTDGRIVVTNICVEAGVSRTSYYRSPVAAAVKEALDAPQVPRPDEIGDCRDTIATYSNQIQTLALRNAELDTEIQRLARSGGQEGGSNICPLLSRST